MLAIAIKDLEMQISNLNLLLRKNIIKFKLSIQKKKTSKQMANMLYYKY